MANSYSKVYLQLVFAVKHRHALIPKEHKEELHKYITGIVQNRKHLMYAINSVPNHVHIFLALKPDQSISDLVKDIKTGSTHFINESRWCQHKFQWQEGFGCFSYSPSHVQNVVQYVMNQEKHHANASFKKEYHEFLKEFNIDFEERYLFDWLE